MCGSNKAHEREDKRAVEAEGTRQICQRWARRGSTGCPREDRPGGDWEARSRQGALESQAAACWDLVSRKSQMKIPPALGDHCLGSNGEKARKGPSGKRGRPLRRLCSLPGEEDEGLRRWTLPPHRWPAGTPTCLAQGQVSIPWCHLLPWGPLPLLLHPHPPAPSNLSQCSAAYSQSCWLNYLRGLARY